MNKIFASFSGCLCLVLIFGRTEKVNLTVNNSTSVDLTARVALKDAHGVQKREILFGDLKAGEKVSRSLKAPRSGQIEVIGALPGSADVSSETRSLTGKSPEDLSFDLKLRPEVLNLKNAKQKITNAIGQLGPNVGFVPISVQNALDTELGALIVFKPPAPNEEPKPPLFKLNPGQFSPAMTATEFAFPNTSSNDTAKITGSATFDLSASMPLISKLSVNFGRTSVYEMSWTISGFGSVNKKEPSNWDYFTAMQGLSSAHKAGICQALEQEPSAVIMYVNTMYVLSIARFDVKEGQKLAVGVKADGAAVISGGAAYSFESSRTQTESFQSLALNIGGPQWKIVPAMPGDAVLSCGSTGITTQSVPLRIKFEPAGQTLIGPKLFIEAKP